MVLNINIIKIENETIFLLSLLVFLLVLFFYISNFYNILKKEGKILLSVEKNKLKKFFFLDILFLFSIFSFSLYFSDIKIKTNEIKGIVYLFLIDSSGSMKAQDLYPNRMEVAKELTIDFVRQNNGKFGIIHFSDYPKLLVFPSEDKKSVIEKIKKINASGGTNLGDSLSLAYSILENFPGYKKVIILLSDGKPTVGSDPLEIVKKNKDKATIFTIAVGKENYLIGYDILGNPILAEIDKELLKEIAKITKGKFFEVENKEEFIKAYKYISEKTKDYYYKPLKEDIALFSFVLFLIFFVLKFIFYLFY